jgi:protein involved in polysaccharide export with SLBB domain
LNSAFNALAAAGGPEEQGSVRKIEVIRGKERKSLDVYRFMKDPSIQHDFDLQHNDVLFVPMAEQVVRLDGAVRRPMRYELIAGEGLKQLIELAGGLRYNTYVEYVQIERSQADSVVLLEFRLQDILDGKQNPNLRDGDVVRIRESSRPLESYAEVVGSVFYPGRYDLTPNLTLTGVLQRAQTTPESRLQFYMVERKRRDGTTELLRVSGDEAERFTLQPRDLIRVFDKATFTDTYELAVQGAVRRPFNRPFELGDMISLSDALQLAGGTEPTAHPEAVVRRRDPSNPKIEEYLRLDINRPGDFKLQAGDQLTVYDRMTYTRTAGLSISGAVRNARMITYDPQLTLSDMILMAGGFTESADPERIDLFRLEYGTGMGSNYNRISLKVDSQYRGVGSAQTFRLAPFDQIYVRKLPLFDLNRSVRIDGQVMYPGEYLLKEYRMHLSELIREAGGINKLGEKKYAVLIRPNNNIRNVGINLEKSLKNPGSRRFDPVLVEGDEIKILTFSNTVGIRMKATRQEEIFADVLGQDNKGYEVSDYVYQGKHRARWYVRKLAGGFADKADKSSITVRYPDGSVRGTSNYMIFKRTPPVRAGSVVALEYKLEKPKEDKKDVDVDLVFARTLQALTSLTTVLLLLTRL